MFYNGCTQHDIEASDRNGIHGMVTDLFLCM